MLIENTAAIAEMELADGPISMDGADRTARELIERYELDVQGDSCGLQTGGSDLNPHSYISYEPH